MNWTINTTMEKESNLISLYDYLGKPAGRILGGEVAKIATSQKIEMGKRYISNKKYTGDVILYPKSFLDRYFASKRKIQ